MFNGTAEVNEMRIKGACHKKTHPTPNIYLNNNRQGNKQKCHSCLINPKRQQENRHSLEMLKKKVSKWKKNDKSDPYSPSSSSSSLDLEEQKMQGKLFGTPGADRRLSKSRRGCFNFGVSDLLMLLFPKKENEISN